MMRNICFFICSLVNILAIQAPPKKKSDKQTITSQLEEEQVNVFFFFFFIFGSKNVKIQEHYQEHKKQGMECLDEVQEVK